MPSMKTVFQLPNRWMSPRSLGGYPSSLSLPLPTWQPTQEVHRRVGLVAVTVLVSAALWSLESNHLVLRHRKVATVQKGVEQVATLGGITFAEQRKNEARKLWLLDVAATTCKAANILRKNNTGGYWVFATAAWVEDEVEVWRQQKAAEYQLSGAEAGLYEVAARFTTNLVTTCHIYWWMWQNRENLERLRTRMLNGEGVTLQDLDTPDEPPKVLANPDKPK